MMEQKKGSKPKTVEHDLQVLPVAPEKPIADLPPGMRLGVLVRRTRLRAEQSLREVADALADDGFDKLMLASVERGRLPMSWEQVEAFCTYIGVGTGPFEEAVMDFHRGVWSDPSGRTQLLEMIEKVGTTVPIYDQVELVAALRSAVATMDIAKGVLERAMRIMRIADGFERDAAMTAKAALLLGASRSHSLALLENPPDPMPVPERKSEEDESLAQRDDDEGIEKKSYVPRISLDFDGVINSYQSGWAGDAKIIPDPPVPGAFGFIEEAIERGYDVAIFSTRSHVTGATDAMHDWLIEHGMNEKIAALVKFPKKKPNAMLLIDDRGYHFKGTFPSWEYIDGFKPWNKGGERDDVEGTRYPPLSEKE